MNLMESVNSLGKFGNGLSDFLFGTDSQINPFNRKSLKTLQSFLPGGGLNRSPLYQSGSNFLKQLFSNSPEAFRAFEAPLMQQFEQQIVPGIAERFAGMGTGGGASSSSALNQALAQAARNLSTDIAGIRSNAQLQAIPQGLNYSQQPLQNILQAAGLIPNQYYEIPGQPGLMQSGLNAFAQGFAGSFGNRLGGGS